MKRINSLQTVRALAFIGVFISHSRMSYFSAWGAWGVSVFLVLSGFVTYYSYGNNVNRLNNYGFIYSVKHGVNKIKRLYLLHIITMIGAIPFLIERGVGLLNSSIRVFFNTLLLHSWVPDSDLYFGLNGVSWYLSVCLFLYICTPLIIFFMNNKYHGVSTALSVIIITVLLQVVLAYLSFIIQTNAYSNNEFVQWFTYIFPLSRLEDFIIGCNLAYIFMNCKKDKNIPIIVATILEIIVFSVTVLECIIFYYIRVIPNDKNNWYTSTVMWTISSSFLIYLFALNKGCISKIMTNKMLLFIANVSATAFLIHHLLFRYLDELRHILGLKVNGYVDMICCFVLTMILSIIWNKFVMLHLEKLHLK